MNQRMRRGETTREIGALILGPMHIVVLREYGGEAAAQRPARP